MPTRDRDRGLRSVDLCEGKGPLMGSAALEQPLLFGGPSRPANEAAARSAAIALRPYQGGAIEQVYAYRAPGARVLCCAPTGAGKTVIGSRMILDELAGGGVVIFIAHRAELIEQTYGKLLAMGLDERSVGVVMADGVITHPVTGHRVNCERPHAPVQVASIDTLRRRALPARVSLIIVDECHRALARSYRDVMDACPDAFVVGLTATPYRGDGRGLGDVFNRLVVVTTPRRLMEEGYLAEPRVFSHPHRADLSRVKTTAGDYDQEQLAEAVDKKELIGSIVEHWGRHLRGVRTVAFATNVAHSNHVVEMFRAAGVPAEHLDGETPAAERKAILARVDSGETLVVSNCGVLCEGWDQPSVKGCILARPTKSRALYVQQAGRVLRPWRWPSWCGADYLQLPDGTVVPCGPGGWATPVILDHAGCVLEHDLPHADWEITLEGKKKRAKASVSVKECPKCFAAVASNAATCFFCGHPFVESDPSKGKEPKERDGQLVEVRADALRALKLQTAPMRAELQDWAQRVDERHGLEPGTTNRWCKHTFRKSRSEMSVEEIGKVRAWFLSSEPWLDEPPPPRLLFQAPPVEEVVAW